MLPGVVDVDVVEARTGADEQFELGSGAHDVGADLDAAAEDDHLAVGDESQQVVGSGIDRLHDVVVGPEHVERRRVEIGDDQDLHPPTVGSVGVRCGVRRVVARHVVTRLGAAAIGHGSVEERAESLRHLGGRDRRPRELAGDPGVGGRSGRTSWRRCGRRPTARVARGESLARRRGSRRPTATAARSVTSVTVCWPPVDSCWPLSSSTWTRFGGCSAPMVARAPSRMSAAPSPSMTITRCCGRAMASPSPTLEAQPMDPTT